MSPALQHIMDCAEEMGVDPFPATSNEKRICYQGRVIEVYYMEDSNSPWAWRAFVMTLGTVSGRTEEEVIASAKAKIQKGSP
jgi:hypothetical protein